MLKANVEQVFENNGGVLRLSQAPSLGLSKEAVCKMYHRGDLEKVHSGVYVRVDDLPDELVLLQAIYPKGILSHESAAALYGFTTFTPSEPIFSFPQDFKLPRRDNLEIAPHYLNKNQYKTGMTEVLTWEGNPIRAYNQEKTLIDLARSRDTLPLIFKEAVDGYLTVGNVHMNRLMAYAEQFGVLDKIRNGVAFYT